ncbi:MAG: c-type cytochrome [Telluria sp.]
MRAIAIILVLLPWLASAAPQPGTVAGGQAIYRQGVLGDGTPLAGRSAAGITRTGREAACISCHRRSGFGIAEGPLVVRPITAPDLFGGGAAPAPNPRIQHQLGQRLRPVYDSETLARAIRSGVGADGRALDAMMPRYPLGDADMAALQAYLRTLSPSPAPGVDAGVIRLATVIQPGVEPRRSQAMLDVLRAFVRDKNAAVRSEPERRRAGTMRMHRAWRSWVLDVWELRGDPSGWREQLEAYQRNGPAFALVAGIGDASWQPVHDFSERNQVPCILPLTSLPGEGGGFYTVYFSRGMALEAEALALELRKSLAGRRVLQVVRTDDPQSVAAGRALSTALTAGGVVLDQLELSHAPDAADRARITHTDTAALVLWLRAPDLARLPAGERAVYASGSLLDGADVAAPSQLRVIYPWELPQVDASRARRARDWLRARGLGAAAPREAIDALFAVSVTAEALGHLMDSFSRDYFVETVEHQLSTTILASSRPPLTLGPDQRFASKGVYIAAPAVLRGTPEAAPPLIVP